MPNIDTVQEKAPNMQVAKGARERSQHFLWQVAANNKANYDSYTWALYSFTSGDLDEAKSYYIYVKAPTDTTEAATFLFSDTAKQMEDETGFYLLLFGFLNKPDSSGAHSFAQMYGYSEILPGRITTDKVVSQDGKTGFDLVNGRIYGNIEFNASEDNTALINNIINANTTVASASTSASTALTTAKEALAKAEEVAGDVNPNLLRGTEYMRIGDGTWESASFIKWGSRGTFSTLDNSRLSSFTGEDTPSEVKTAGLLITPTKDSTDTTYTREAAFFQEIYNSDCDTAEGDTVTMSAYVWASQGPMRWRYIQYGDGRFPDYSGNINQGWNKVALTVTQPTTPRGSIFYYRSSNTFTEQPYMIWANIKLEKGSEATAWCEANEDKNYLKEAIAEATQGTTTLGGGLVLSKYMGVRDNSGVIVAGMSGTTQATAGTLPMIWAGATANTTAGQKAAAFRVNGNSGEVVMTKGKIVGGEGSNGMVIENGTIKLGTVASETIPDNKVNMLISPTTGMTSISTIINATSTADISGTLTDPSSTTASQKWGTSGANGVFDTNAITKTATLWSKTIGTSVKAGTLYFSFNEKNLAATLTETAHVTAGSGKTAYLFLQSSYEVWVENGSSKATLLKGEIAQETVSGTNPSATRTASGTYSTMTSILFSPGDTIAIKATVTANAGGAYSSSSSTASVPATLEASAALAIKFNSAAYSSKIPVYNNHYFGNGFMLSTASNKYLAASSAATDGNILQARSSSALFKFTANGLLQSLNGSTTFYRVNPLVAIMKLAYNAATTSGYKAEYLYRIKGSTSPKANREATGNVLLTHYLNTNTGVSTYAAQGTYYCTGSTEYSRTLMFDNIASNSMRVHFMIGNSHYDPQNAGYIDYAMIFFFDYGTYN